jgi:hypothetical protein
MDVPQTVAELPRQKLRAPGQEQQFTGIFECLQRTIKDEGVLALYSWYGTCLAEHLVGTLVSNTCAGFILSANNFASGTSLCQMYMFVSGLGSACAGHIVGYPLNTVCTRLQAQVGHQVKAGGSVCDQMHPAIQTL